MKNDLEDLVKRVSRLETRNAAINWAERKILETAHNITRLRTGNFYMEGDKRYTVHYNEIPGYIKMFEGNLLAEVENLQAAKCD